MNPSFVARLGLPRMIKTLMLGGAALQMATAQERAGGEANLVLPDLDMALFFGDTGGRTLLLLGCIVGFLGLVFGLVIYRQLKNLPVHKSMLEVSELIYATCRTYLETQGKFLMILEAFIAIVIVVYFGVLLKMEAFKVHFWDVRVFRFGHGFVQEVTARGSDHHHDAHHEDPDE